MDAAELEWIAWTTPITTLVWSLAEILNKGGIGRVQHLVDQGEPAER